MLFSRLDGTELSVSRICLGTMTFGGQADSAATKRMVDHALAVGVNFFDCANVYNRGESERVLGEALGSRRNDVILASKVGLPFPPLPGGLKKATIMHAAEESLSRLRTDYLDLYYLHAPDWVTPPEESLDAMDTLVRSGKVRYIGSSNYPSWEACRLLWSAEKLSFPVPRIAQQMYNLIARRIEDEFLPFARTAGVSTIAYNPLAGGLLSGKHQLIAPQPGTRFDGNQTYLDRYWNRQNHEAIEQLCEVAAGAGRTLISLSLNWLLHHTLIASVILGASRFEQLEENLKAVGEGPLPPEALAKCDEVWLKLRGPSPNYSR